MRPAIVTDSNSQLPPGLRDRFGIEVVPIVVVVDGVEYREGVDLDADGFYEFFDGTRTPEVSTSQPSPGAFVDAYRRCHERGHDQIVSIHVTDAFSGTLNSARLAAESSGADVHLVDTGTASFGVGCCVWEAALAVQAGADASAAADVARATAGRLHSITAVGAAALLEASGRAEFSASGRGVDLFTTDPSGGFEALEPAVSESEVCDRLAAAMHADGAPIRVALGIADATAMPYYEGLEARLVERDDVVEIVRYRIGPSIGAFTGPGTAGGFWYRV